MRFKEFLAEQAKQNAPDVTIVELEQDLLEHEVYKDIPKTNSSYRTDAANTNKQTQQHVHVYAKPKGSGKEMYALNQDGSGHDGSSGIKIPKKHADYFRSQGYDVKDGSILECIEIEDSNGMSFYILTESDDV
jgi:hypothetical protein